jgi:hypothetical protein
MRWQWTLLVGVVGCTSWRAKSSYDAAAASREYRTYRLLGAETMQPAVESALGQEVERQLASKGLAPAAPGQQPDVVVIYDLARTVRPDRTPPGSFNGWGRSWGAMAAPRALAYGYHERTVVLRFVDSRTRQTFWNGSASTPVGSPTSPKEVTSAVDHILRRFPSEAVAGGARPVG